MEKGIMDLRKAVHTVLENVYPHDYVLRFGPYSFEDIVDQVVLKELKTAKEQVDSCPADRTDLLEEYKLRYDIIAEYAPKMMSEEEIVALLEKDFAEVLASKNKGQIMKSVMPALKGKADGKLINQIVARYC